MKLRELAKTLEFAGSERLGARVDGFVRLRAIVQMDRMGDVARPSPQSRLPRSSPSMQGWQAYLDVAVASAKALMVGLPHGSNAPCGSAGGVKVRRKN